MDKNNGNSEDQIGVKFDNGKPQLSLIPPKFVIQVAEVMSFGAKKYGVGNWKYLQSPKERYKDALLRHLYAYLDGELNDPETGMPHLAHLATNTAFLMHFEEEEAKGMEKWSKAVKNSTFNEFAEEKRNKKGQ